MKNIGIILVVCCSSIGVSLATRYARSVKSPQRYLGGGGGAGSYGSGAPLSPSRARFSSPSSAGSYGGSSGGAGYAALAAGAGSYGGGSAAGGSYGGGFGGGASSGGARGSYGGGSYEEQHPAPEPYNFQFQADDNYGNNQYRNEEQDKSGTIRGSYGYTDANGLYRIVDYVADDDGFRAQIRSNEPGGLTELSPSTGSVENPADVQLSAEPVPAAVRQQQQQYQRYNGPSGHGATAGSGRYRAGGSAGAAAHGGSSYGGGSGFGGGSSFGGSSSYGGGGSGSSSYGGGAGSSSNYGGSSFGGSRPITQQKLQGFDKY